MDFKDLLKQLDDMVLEIKCINKKLKEELTDLEDFYITNQAEHIANQGSNYGKTRDK